MKRHPPPPPPPPPGPAGQPVSCLPRNGLNSSELLFLLLLLLFSLQINLHQPSHEYQVPYFQCVHCFLFPACCIFYFFTVSSLPCSLSCLAFFLLCLCDSSFNKQNADYRRGGAQESLDLIFDPNMHVPPEKDGKHGTSSPARQRHVTNLLPYLHFSDPVLPIYSLTAPCSSDVGMDCLSHQTP